MAETLGSLVDKLSIKNLRIWHLEEVLEKNSGEPITITTIVDIMNLIGKCVVAGNVRRTAEIVFGDPESDEYINLKN